MRYCLKKDYLLFGADVEFGSWWYGVDFAGRHRLLLLKETWRQHIFPSLCFTYLLPIEFLQFIIDSLNCLLSIYTFDALIGGSPLLPWKNNWGYLYRFL